MFCSLFLGESSYLDFSRPHTRAWYSRCFGLDKYEVAPLGAASWPHRDRGRTQICCLSSRDRRHLYLCGSI